MKEKQERYIDVNFASDIFGVSKNTVTGYCRKGEIKGCKKDDNGRWLIPYDSIKPLSKHQKVIVLQSILIVKNNPQKKPQWFFEDEKACGLELTYKYLYDHGYIESYKKTKKSVIKAEKIQLTDEGMKLALSGGNKARLDITTLSTLLGLATQFASLYFQYLSLK